MFGITGAVEDDTPIGAVVMPARVIDHATGRTHEHHPPGGEATAGALWTTDIMTPVGRSARPHRARASIALDMETAATQSPASATASRGLSTGPISDHATDDSIDDEVFHLVQPGRHAELGQHRALLREAPAADPVDAQAGQGRQAGHGERGRRRHRGQRGAAVDHSGAKTAVTTRSAASEDGPSHVMAPWSSSTTRSHSASAWPTCCSTMSSAVPAAAQALEARRRPRRR